MNRRIEAAVLAGLLTISCGSAQAQKNYSGDTPTPGAISTPKVTPTEAIPTQKVSTPEPVTTENGLKRFRSVHFPYQIDYPANWIYDTSGGNDVFLNNQHPQGFENLNTAGVAISVTPVQSFVTLESFAQQRFDSLKSRAQIQGSSMDFTVDGKPAKRLAYIIPSGMGTREIDLNFNNRLETAQRNIFVDEMLVLIKDKMYLLQFAGDRSLIHGDSNPELMFVKMFRSFKSL